MLGSQGISWDADGWVGEWVDGDNDDGVDDGDDGGRRGMIIMGGHSWGDLTTPLETFVIACPGQVR